MSLPLLLLFAVGILGPDFIAWGYWRLFDQALAAAFVGIAALLVYLVVRAQQRAEADAVAAVPGDALVLMRGRASCDLDGGYLIVTSDRLLFSSHGLARKAPAPTVRRWALRDLTALTTPSGFGLRANVLQLRFADGEIRLVLRQRDRWRAIIAAAAAQAGARLRVDGEAG